VVREAKSGEHPSDKKDVTKPAERPDSGFCATFPAEEANITSKIITITEHRQEAQVCY
jgi:hypothetical protein